MEKYTYYLHRRGRAAICVATRSRESVLGFLTTYKRKEVLVRLGHIAFGFAFLVRVNRTTSEGKRHERNKTSLD